MSQISDASVTLIVTEEVSSPAFYTAHYQRPVWPGGLSGVTIGVGYDVGAGVSSEAQLRHDWQAHLSEDMIAALVPAIRMKGDAARKMAVAIQSRVVVPWASALAVFEEVDIPRWFGRCAVALANFEPLTKDCRGAILSLAYNRGVAGFVTGDREDRYREMRAIAAHLRTNALDKIPAEFRSMKRIWPKVAGLQHRREHEALLFEAGLRGQPAVLPTNPAPLVVAPSVRTVSRLQRALDVLGADPVVEVSGVADQQTKAAVITFQGRFNLARDGVAGPKTWALIELELTRMGKTVS